MDELRGSLQACEAISTGRTLFALFVTLRKQLEAYCATLESQLEKLEKSQQRRSDDAERARSKARRGSAEDVGAAVAAVAAGEAEVESGGGGAGIPKTALPTRHMCWDRALRRAKGEKRSNIHRDRRTIAHSHPSFLRPESEQLGDAGFVWSCGGSLNLGEDSVTSAASAAAGFGAGRLAKMVLWENLVLLLGGLATGVLAATFAVVPHMFFTQAAPPGSDLVIMIGIIIFVGMAAGLVAVRATLQAPLISSLRGD